MYYHTQHNSEKNLYIIKSINLKKKYIYIDMWLFQSKNDKNAYLLTKSYIQIYCYFLFIAFTYILTGE